MNISVVVPCYNEHDNITELYERLIKTFNKNKLDLGKIILIDDGSNDNTWNKISQFILSKLILLLTLFLFEPALCLPRLKLHIF